MFNLRDFRRGIAFYLVLGVLLIVTVFATVIMNLMLSQARLTHHQISRIQAYYAAMAGINYALEMLRIGQWTYTPVNSCPNPTGCLINDSDFPPSIRSQDGNPNNRHVRIIFCPQGATCAGTTKQCSPPTGINFCVQANVNYLYQ
ncbi:MAG: hypothetical protein NC908_04415 [Candidatus Omnitrophica bacterium]|nr:hypothetical protein [Candidatus Omnitrophota bacterium]